jgi:predicted O-methyltransferase YrrM
MSTATLENHVTTTTAAPTPAEKMFKFIENLWAGRAVYVAAKIGLADHLADGPKSAEQLAAATNTHAASLYRVLRALAGIEVIRETSHGKFVLTPFGEALRSNVAGSLRATAIVELGEDHYAAWENLLHSVRTGETAFDNKFGMPIWKFYEQNPENGSNFDRCMVEMTGAIHQAILEAYDFAPFTHLTDVGGGHGALVAAILSEYPDLRGTVFDQPHVADGARKTFADANLRQRTAAVGGDFFESVPAGADLYTMKFIIHDWDDQRCVRILKNIRRGIAPGGKLLIFDTVIPEGNAPHFGKLFDLNMLVMTGGRERTEKEFAALLREGGFHLARVVPTESAISIVEAVPA